MSVEEIDDSVTTLESARVKDVTKMGRIGLPILNVSRTHTDIHISASFFQRKEDRLLMENILFCKVFVNILYISVLLSLQKQ